MTYVSRKVRQRQKWITLKEALYHVMAVEKCGEGTAWEQLRAALEDWVVPSTRALTDTELDVDDPAKVIKRIPGLWTIAKRSMRLLL